MGKKVTVYTSATNPETGQVVNLAPGDEAPSWAKLGDHVYADEDTDDLIGEEPVAGPGQSALTKRQADALEADAKADAKAEAPAKKP